MKILWTLLFLIRPVEVGARAGRRLITLTLEPMSLRASDFFFITVHCDCFSRWMGGALRDVRGMAGWLEGGAGIPGMGCRLEGGAGIPGMDCWLKSGADIPGTDTTIIFVVGMCFAVGFEALSLSHTKLSKKWRWGRIVGYKRHEGDLMQSETQSVSDAFYR